MKTQLYWKPMEIMQHRCYIFIFTKAYLSLWIYTSCSRNCRVVSGYSKEHYSSLALTLQEQLSYFPHQKAEL